MGLMVIVTYEAKPGCDEALLALVKDHVPYLRNLGLATARTPMAMRSKSGLLLEVFEWEDGAAERAHGVPEVRALWDKFGAVCDFRFLKEVPEAADMFAHFTPVNL